MQNYFEFLIEITDMTSGMKFGIMNSLWLPMRIWKPYMKWLPLFQKKFFHLGLQMGYSHICVTWWNTCPLNITSPIIPGVVRTNALISRML